VKTQLGVGESGRGNDLAIDETVASSDPSLASSAPLVGAARAADGEPKRGDSIGRFVVLGVLGRGGMGVVYSAYDPHLDRKVAIKLLTQAMHSAADATVRLLREAQAMAKINHVNVIKVHEVGTFNEQIYLAMEFADAGTLRDWLEKPASIGKILEVFVLAGRGLVAAHGVGLVHRDFKPDNVLLSRAGGVQVTDFGLVSVIDALPRAASVPAPDLELTNDTPLSQELTRTGSIMGTPTYMAPEQFSGQPSTAKTDQFSFCVALYEALYKERPFAGTNYMELSSNVLTGAMRPVPAGPKVPNAIRRALVRGLSTDPANRHASMAELLALLTRDPNARRRKLLWTAGAGVVALGVAGFVMMRPHAATCGTGDDRITPVWNGEVRARIASAFEASARLDEQATFEHLVPLVDAWTHAWKSGFVEACRATTERGEQSAHLLDLRMQCLGRRLEEGRSALDALAAGGGDAVDHAIDVVLGLPAVAACADTVALTLEVAPPEQGVVQVRISAARAQINVAKAQLLLGRFRPALSAANKGVSVARTTNYPPVIAEALVMLGRAQSGLAEPASTATFGEANRVALAAGDSNTALEAASWRLFELTKTSRFEPAQELADVSDAMAKHARPRADIAVKLGTTIGLLLYKRGNPKAAEARYLETVELANREIGPDSPSTMSAIQHLGELYKEEGRYPEARKALAQVVAERERIVGKDHPEVAAALSDLANVYRAEGSLDEAKKMYDRALAIRLAALGPDHPEVGNSYNNLGNYFADKGDYVAARTVYARALAIYEKAFGADNVEIMATLVNLGGVLNTLGDHAGARKQYERALRLSEAAYGPDHPEMAGVLNNLGVVANDERRFSDALSYYERAMAITVKAYGPEHPDVVDDMVNITSVYKSLGKLHEAEEATNKTVGLVTKVFGADDMRMAATLVNFAELQMQEKKWADALESARKSLAIFTAKLGPDHPYVAFADLAIARALVELERGAEGVANAEHALRLRIATKASPEQLGEAHFALADTLIATPKTRPRAIAEAKLALAAYAEAKDTDDVTETKIWLRKHR
jgi:tetratricopeptide (TPR) repeat protein